MENQKERCKTGLLGPSGRNSGEIDVKFDYDFEKTKPISEYQNERNIL
jgi:hypothetical protein